MSSTPDGKAEKIDESSIYWNMADTKAKSFANIAYNYWATDLAPGIDNDVAPYLADTSHNIWSQAYDPDLPWNNKEIYFNPKNDPATWQHLVQFVVTLGISGERVYPDDYDALRKGDKNWPKPVADSGSALDDMWHAAVNSRGSYASASNPAALVDSLQRILGGISDRSSKPTISAVNASVLTLGALSFNTGYSTTDWSGVLQAVTLNQDGTTAGVQWDAGTQLDDRTTARSIYTDTMDSVTGKVTGLAFTSTNADSLDATEAAELMVPASSGDDDTSGNRIDYLAGSRKQEDAGVMRKRNHLLGAIINSQPVYVSYPSGGYSDNYPTGSPEAAEDAQTYDEFIQAHADRPGTLYVGANDGMLHAFDASLKCNDTDDDGNCISYGPDPAASAGKELWAFVPRAVYPNLGNLTSVSGFKFAPTVDGTPVIRDVFFGSSSASNTDNKWHTLLVGGLRFGGRGVYALDVTDPTSMAASKVLWEFDHDSPVSAGCVTNDDTACNPDDLGYTYGQPNIGRLANGRWVVIVPTSYYPDCSKGDSPSNCQTLAAASNEYSALFILDAQTGEQIAELKTPTDITGVRSFGLGPPVLGDYENDHIDDVAYAGDLAGNLWRFDLSSSTASDWTVTLAYQPETQGAQPITVMPRLFPDPTTNRFMVVFGTGKYLGADDNKTDDMATQSVYGIRDKLDDKTPVTVTHDDLQEQTMSEVAGSGDLAGVTLRKLSDNDVAADKGGWYIDLVTKDSDGKVTDAGERVVVTPAALFDTNTAIIQTLIPSATDPCDPMLLGSVMLIDANSGGPGSGVSAVGGYPYVGARVNNVRTSGTIPVTTTVGGGKALLPGLTLTGSKKNPDAPFSGDAPIWRRRSWSIINNVH
jgi:type IV pilus assembly protein PilY1